MPKYCFLLLFISLLQKINSQIITGKIIDADNKQPLPFATITLEGTNNGKTADIDGNFEIVITKDVKNIIIQLIGYTKKIIGVGELDTTKVNVIKLKTNAINLFEITVKPKENPAIPIIKQVIINKPKFNITNLPYYFCTTYAKTYFTTSNKTGDENFSNSDSLNNKSGKLFDKSYLLFMESVTEKAYKYKNKSQEKVIASKVSGFKSSPFGSFASQLQSFTFYDDNIELLGLKYVNPLSDGTFKRYNFDISDTILTNLDTTIIIKFHPKKKSNFSGMKGALYINKNQYVLVNVLAEPAEINKDANGIKIQQLYEKIDSIHWFPKQLNTEIYFYGFELKTSDNRKSQIIKGVSKMYIKDIKLDSVIKIKYKNVSVFDVDGFDKKSDGYWNEKRIDILSEKEATTYHLIDSIGKKANFDKKIKLFSALATGKFPIGYLNIDLKHIVRFNEYENLRLGIGLSSSNKLSRRYSVGGYCGYGIKDKEFKYGGFSQINFNRQQSTFLMVEAAHEVIESAGTFFLNEEQNLFSTESFRKYLVANMDKIDFAKASFNASVFNFTKISAYYQIQQRQSTSGYLTIQDNNVINETNNYTINEVGLQFKVWPGEKYAETLGQLISLGSKWPKIFVNFMKGLNSNGFGYRGEFSYTRLDLKIDHQLNFKVKGFISYQLQAGKVFGSVPYSLQYNNKGSRSNTYKLTAEKTFETMFLNEFISTKYAAFFFAINSGKFLKSNKYCNPEFELVHNYGIGTLDNKQNLTNITLNDISKGYSEVGLRIKAIYKINFSSLGAGVYYRYGNYADADPSENFVYKFVVGISF